MRIINPFISKAEAWDAIVADLGLHSPTFVADDEPKKKHTDGRRESRVVRREPREGHYRRTARGYLVRG
jgi:hypothetical protein